MTAVSPLIADRFCDLCFRAYETWQTWMALEAHDPETRMAPQLGPAASGAYRRLFRAVRDQAILQVVRLHDRATIQNNVTLTIDYLVRYGAWDPHLEAKLAALQKDLDAFILAKDGGLRKVRNRALAHNDLAAVLADQDVSLFEHGADKVYFSKLEEFASLVTNAVKGTGYMFTDSAERDGQELIKRLYSGSTRTEP